VSCFYLISLILSFPSSLTSLACLSLTHYGEKLRPLFGSAAMRPRCRGGAGCFSGRSLRHGSLKTAHLSPVGFSWVVPLLSARRVRLRKEGFHLLRKDQKRFVNMNPADWWMCPNGTKQAPAHPRTSPPPSPGKKKRDIKGSTSSRNAATMNLADGGPPKSAFLRGGLRMSSSTA
jgi:hypothetical protein